MGIAWATEGLCTARHVWPKPPGEGTEKVCDFPCKHLHQNLGVLFRWRYTEMIKPQVESLRLLAADDELLLKGLGYIADAFDRFGWTRLAIPEQQLRDGKPLFSGTPEECINQLSGCPELAARDDLKDLCENDRAVITATMERVFSSNELRRGYSRMRGDLFADDHLAWFAKYAPQKLAELASRYRLTILGSGEVGPALHFISQLPYSPETVPSAELLKNAKIYAERELNAPSGRSFWPLLQLHVLAFTCFDKDDLKDWLVFASDRENLRREIHFYPIPILCPLLLPDPLARYAREQAKECFNDLPSNPVNGVSAAEFDYWAILGGFAGPPDPEFHKWASERLRNGQGNEDRRFCLLLLWLRSAPALALEVAVADGSLLEFLGHRGLHPMISAGRCRENWQALVVGFDQLLKQIPIGDLGTILLSARRDADFSRWGHLMFNKALDLVGHPPFEREFWGTTIHTVDYSGTIIGSSCDREEAAPRAVSDRLRQTERLPGATTAIGQSTGAWERRANDGIRIWQKDQDRLKELQPDALDRFGAIHPLRVWRDRHEDSFLKYASILLAKASSEPIKAFHIAGFVTCVIDALVALDPELAMEMESALGKDSVRVDIVNEYGISSFLAAIWNSAGQGNEKCREICRGFAENSKSDEELMSHAITAQSECATEALKSICAELLRDALAKNRCLAVSLLAWIPDESTINNLDALSINDSSGWVRKHAQWAYEVVKHEASVRRYYAQTLETMERNVASARLQVLLPALTPFARWWHHEIETQSVRYKNAPTPVAAAVQAFWYDLESKSKGSTELVGRKIGEYCRGERVSDLTDPKPRFLGA